MIGKAFIPAAGLGTRLGGLTKSKPKALVEVKGTPMLELTIERLKKAGVNKFLVNVHHFGDEVIDFIHQKNHFGVDLQISDERSQLLDTGGALVKAKSFFEGNEAVLVHNVDVISEIDYHALLRWHKKNEASISLCVRERKSTRALLFSKLMQLKGWTNFSTGEVKWVSEALQTYQAFAFSGIYLIEPEFIDRIPFNGKFSIIDTWLEMAKTERIFGYLDLSPNWFDLGTPEKLKNAEAYLKNQNMNPNHMR